MLTLQAGFRLEYYLGQIADFDLTWHHEDGPTAEQLVWVALQRPGVSLLVECLHAHRLHNTLPEVLALLL